MTNSGGAATSAEARRAASIVEELGKNSGSADVFAAFEELDSLPPDVVRSVLTPWTGPAPDPQRLDPATRKAHGFPAPPLEVRTVRIVRPQRVQELDRVGQEQVRVAGTTWDGLDLPASARLEGERSESSFAGTLERRAVTDASGHAIFDVLLYGEDSGAIFRAGTTDLVGAIAYGKVEMADRRARIALQGSLETKVAEVVTPAVVAAPAIAVAPAAIVRVAAAAPHGSFTSEAPTRGAVKEPSTKVMAAEKVTATKKATAKKPAAKKPAAKKTAAKKTAAKKPAAKKTAAKKAATKTAVAKKAAAKKPAAKKPAAKKPAAKKAATKKPAAKKASAKKAVAKKPAAKKPAAKKPAVKSR